MEARAERGDGIDASWVDPSVDLWTENENIFDRSERSLLAPLLFTDAAAAETFFKAVPCDAMPSPLLSSDLPWPRGRLARLGEIINFDAKNRRRIGIGGRGRSMRRGGARRQGGIRICMFYSNFVGYGSEMELILLTRTTAQHCLHGN